MLSTQVRDSSGTLVTSSSWTYDAVGNVLTPTDADYNVTVNGTPLLLRLFKVFPPPTAALR